MHEAFDTREYYFVSDPTLNPGDRGRIVYQATGAIASYIYPLDFYHRASLGAGYIYRKDAEPIGDTFNPTFIEFTNQFPIIEG